MIFCCCAYHCWATDIDHLNSFARTVLKVVGALPEWVEVADDEIEWLDAVLIHVGNMLGIGWVSQNAAVDLRVQRDDTVIQNCGDTGDISNVSDWNSGVSNGPSGSPAGDQRPPKLAKRLSEFDDAGLVVHGDQSGRHGMIVGLRSSRFRNTGWNTQICSDLKGYGH